MGCMRGEWRKFGNLATFNGLSVWLTKTGKQGVQMVQSLQHDDWLLGQLQDAEFAAAYLNAANEDDGPQTYLAAALKATGLKISIAPASGATQSGQ